MKKLLIIAMVASLTGCGTIQEVAKQRLTPPIELAKEECAKMSFKVGTNAYQNCVMRQVENIRNTRAILAVGSQNAAHAAPTITQCYRTGSYVNCTSN